MTTHVDRCAAKRNYTLFAAALLVWVTGCGQNPPQREVIRPVKAMKVLDVAQFRERTFPGRAKAAQEVELSFRVSGPLITRSVDVGDEVKQGDVVARIDPRDFEVNLRNVQGQLGSAKAALQRAQSDYARVLRLFKKDPGATSQTAIDIAREERDRARANIQSLEASVAAAKDQLRYTYLHAPFSGTVVATYVENFEDVNAKQAIVRLIDHSRIEMVVNIPESLISFAPQVKNIEVVFDAFPGRAIPAQIKEIGKEASETTRTYPVTLVMDQPEDIEILPGMAGKSTGAPSQLGRDAPVIVEVPLSATFSTGDPDETAVWVIDEDTKTVSRREVRTGAPTDRGIRIIQGLKPGEWIATAGVNSLRAGQRVTILREPAE